MKKKRLIIRTVILAVLLCAVGYTLYAQFFADKQKVSVGDKAPDFILRDVNGETHQLSDYKGKGVFLNFWGTWCKPCKQEMPAMEKQYASYKKQGVEILAVNVAETNIAVEQFAKQYELSFPILMDKDSQVLGAYGIDPLPTTFLIDKNGKIVDSFIGGLEESKIKEYMEEIKP
ncbi:MULTISPECIES: thiol-disulfide oxidoreductase ResA [Priestia]|jgi:peroxiredoxin|uniref:Cytochrome c biogenesis protein n=4 Tax=Priestia TaxID=2800373 RepID=D5DRK2_PRIM1|nr:MULTISPECIES: thiol-disulfide oxidoreductase ResA [Priestia]AVX10260.1 thiol-disulfide oxidoreductase [Bacillus sp. Y-01]KOP76351.1 thiol-disulfide oxidoreductase [Bacillus sp. FJAT-21351]KQU11120.1 thiol-disulfide oxidoreductase [Bacillus sp. Leaf75]KRF57654.1 thiol-disulfide oxidoreductase [Bacillus sp. Soil531]MBZ5478128.1 thiol-disulfide oxidoreductase ResA [Bacillus sp. T_4]MCF6798249.1 thiol-disulfide oxidoreductase ResA [Bacillus sp. ET1]MDH6652612.1 peroxiredoxin [Bacillus sp. PvP